MMTRSQIRELVAFLATGLTAYVVYTGLFLALRAFMPDFVAISIAYVVAWIVHFLLTTQVVFRHRVAGINGRILGRYVLLYMVSYGLSVTTALTAIQAGAQPVFATAAGVAVTTVFNYLVSRFWVFR